MRLEAKKVEEGSEELRDGKSEASLEMCKEHHPLTELRGGNHFLAGYPTDDLRADPA